MAARIFRRFITYTRIKPQDFAGRRLQSLVARYCEEQEKMDNRCAYANIKGTKFHTSSKDRMDSKKVLSTQFFDENGSRVGTGHLHEDGTSKFRYKKRAPSESADEGNKKRKKKEEEEKKKRKRKKKRVI